MLIRLFIIAYLIQWFAVSIPISMSKMCKQFRNTMNRSDSKLNCLEKDQDVWRFETSNIIVEITLHEDKMLEIECLQSEESIQEELIFLPFSSFKYNSLILNSCNEIPNLNTNVNHLEVSNIENFDLKKFSNLQELHLTNVNKIQNLNDLSILEELSIEGMQLPNLTLKLDRLIILTLKFNNITDHLNGVRLENLKKLYLHSNQNLQHMNFDKFPNLLELNIDEESADVFYDINQMKLNQKLETLVISNICNSCNDSEIYNENLFGGHQNLRTIILTNNRISNIRNYRIFHDLPYLETLNLNENKLRDVDFLVGSRLPRLRVLKLGNNQIKALDHSLYTLTALEHLFLYKNDMKRIDDDFFKKVHANLSCIDLQNNKLAFLTNKRNNPFVKIASSLVKLNLKSNRLNQFSEHFINFDRLTNLDVSHNSIMEIRSTNLNFNHPITVNFESNKIRKIRFLGNENFNMVTLKFGGNVEFESENCSNYEFIKYVCLNRGPLMEFPTLNHLNISEYVCFEPIRSPNNSLCADDQCVCKKRPYTKDYLIDCRNKNLTKLPAELPNFRDSSFSMSIDLDNNNFAGISNFELPAIYYTKISRLSLRNCSLNNFVMFPLHDNRITELYLDDNQIPNFSYDVLENCTNLKNLTLFNNRFECNCNTEYLYNFLTLSKYYNPDLLRCANRNMTNFMQNKNYIVCQIIMTVITSLVVSLIFVIIVAVLIIVKLKLALELKLLTFVIKVRFFNTTGSTIKYPYDIFLSYSDDDTDFVEKNILSKLESDTKSPYNHIVTINRDSMYDKMIDEQIVHFVNNSKFIVIVLSKNFLESDWNRFTFRAAYCNAFQNNRYPAIIILKDELKELNAIDPALKSYLTMRMYLTYGSRFFWKRINYILSK